MRILKSIWQNPDEPECGAACLAMLAGVTLEVAKSKLFGDEKRPRRVGRNEILKQLSKFGFKAVTKSPIVISSGNPITAVTGHALVYARSLSKEDRENYSESHHWVVWDGKAQCVRDPLAFRKPLKLTSYTELK